MSVQAMGRVMECSRATGVTRMVLLLIANHETEDRGAWPSIERLAREAGAGIRTVQDAIARAKKLGELEVGYRQGPHGTNVYRVLVGLSTTATLPGTEPTRIRTPQNPHPADERQESAPELKELGVRGSSTASASSHPNLARFDEFWKVYPLKRGKAPARKAFTKALKKASVEEILAGARSYAAERSGLDPSKTKWAEGWLNDERWTDQPSPNGKSEYVPSYLRRREDEEAEREALAEMGITL